MTPPSVLPPDHTGLAVLPLADPSLLKTQCFIDGAWVGEGKDPVNDPASGEEVSRVPRLGAAEAERAVLAAEALDVGPEQVTVEIGDTDLPRGSGAGGASRSASRARPSSRGSPRARRAPPPPLPPPAARARGRAGVRTRGRGPAPPRRSARAAGVAAAQASVPDRVARSRSARSRARND